MNKKTRVEGFTLIELLIVIAIIGILAAVLVPNLLGSRNQAFDTGAMNCGKQIQTAQTNYNGKYFEYADNFNLLNTDLVEACVGDAVQLVASDTEPTSQDGGTSLGDSDSLGNISFAHTDQQEDFEIFVWDDRGSTYYQVTHTTVQAAGEWDQSGGGSNP